jgi:hypothetical protein
MDERKICISYAHETSVTRQPQTPRHLTNHIYALMHVINEVGGLARAGMSVFSSKQSL